MVQKTLFSLMMVVILGLTQISVVQAADYKVGSFKMDFLMDAPLEKIKGTTTAGSGSISVKDEDLKSVKGSIKVDLTQITLHTFEDAEKNKTQTQHMLNWFQVGSDADKTMREKFQYAELVFDGAKGVTTVDGSTVKLDGTLHLHGLSKVIPVELTVNKTDTGYTVKTAKTFRVTLADFDVKPRDITGKILQKTLESLGQKVAKDAEVTIELSLNP